MNEPTGSIAKPWWMSVALAALSFACQNPPRTQRTLHSTILGRDFSLQIYVSDEGMSELPWALVLDSEWHFDNIARAFARERKQAKVRPAVIVGIGYLGKNYRDADFTPESYRAFDPACGGSEAYRRFLREELIPSLESTLPIARDGGSRTLLGHSFGGTLVTEVLLREPALFHQFGIHSAAFSYDDGRAMTEWEEAYAMAHTDLDARVWASFGTSEPIVTSGPNLLLQRRLLARGYASLRWELHELPGHDHYQAGIEAMVTSALALFASVP